VPFFFKQWGGVRKAETGRMLDGQTYDEFPQIEPNPVASPERRSRFLQDLATA